MCQERWIWKEDVGGVLTRAQHVWRDMYCWFVWWLRCWDCVVWGGSKRAQCWTCWKTNSAQWLYPAHLLVLMSLSLAINQRNPHLCLMFSWRLVSATPYLYTKPSLQFTLYTSQLIHFPRSEDFSLRRATSDLVIQSDVIPWGHRACLSVVWM